MFSTNCFCDKGAAIGFSAEGKLEAEIRAMLFLEHLLARYETPLCLSILLQTAKFLSKELAREINKRMAGSEVLTKMF